MNAAEALQRLRDGNQRFVAHLSGTGEIFERRRKIPHEHHPLAAILCCSDARVPTEIVFDHGVGDLFVVRVAGNIATPAQTGSIEYAVAELGAPLVVVLGHSECGAVCTTLRELSTPSGGLSPNLQALVDTISPAVSPIIEEQPGADFDTWVDAAVRANIQQSIEELKRSTILASSMAAGRLTLIGGGVLAKDGYRVVFRAGLNRPRAFLQVILR